MSNTATHALRLLEIIAVIFGLLFVVIQILIRRGGTTIRPEMLITVFKNILTAMFLLVIAAVGITFVFFQEVDPNLILPAGLITLVLVIIFISSALIARALMREQLFDE